jgi:hypothetical protein
MTRGRSGKRYQTSRKVPMKMFIPKHDKVKRLKLLQLNAQVPEEEGQKISQK